MSDTIELQERVIKHKLRKETHKSENQFGFMPKRSTIDGIYLLRGLIERYQSRERLAYNIH